MALTDVAVRKAKSSTRPYKMGDSGGLYLLVRPSGSKHWHVKYRFAGKEKLLSLGPYPLVSIVEAREKRDEAKKLLIANEDPSVKKKRDRLAAELAARNTFGLVAEEYLAILADKGLADATMQKHRWLLQDVASPLASRPIDDINSADLLDLLRRVERSGRRETAKKLRADISSVFRLAMMSLRADRDPTEALRGALLAPKRTSHAAITNERDFGAFLVALDDFTGWPTLKAAMAFQILTCTRPGEVRGARREEFDIATSIWRIPAHRMKMRRPHEVPLSRQAKAILESVSTYSEDGEFAFPSIRSKAQPLSENAFNAAIRRMGYSGDEVTAHGFRSTASTILNSRGFDADVIEAVLAHQDDDAIRRTYNRSTYWTKRVKLMQDWANLLDRLRAGSVDRKSRTGS